MGWTVMQTRAHGLGEFATAWRGFSKMQGGDPDRRPMTRADLERLKEKHENGRRRKRPDKA